MLTRLDDRFIDHQKVERAAEIIGRHGYERAFGAATWGIAYANRRLSDGFLSTAAVRKYEISQQTIDALVSAGLWEATEGGYQIHDFLDWNPSAAEVKAKQSKDRARKRKDFGFATDSTRIPSGIHTEPERIPSRVVIQDRSGQDREGVEGESEREAPSLVAARFERFWDAYPRHVSKQDARKLFEKLNPDHELLATILDAIRRQKLSPAWREQRFIMHPDRWLRGRHWEDEPLSETRQTPTPAPTWQAHCPHRPPCLIVTTCPEAWAWLKSQTADEVPA